jgi:hypothetical protein
VYENEFSQLLKLLLNTGLLLECRRLKEAREEIAAGIDFAQKTKSGLGMIHFLGCQAQLHLLLDDPAAAESALDQADAIRRDLQPVPWQLSAFRRSRAELGLYRLQEALAGGGEGESLKQKVQAYQYCRALVRQGRKVAQYRTDGYRLIGLFFWLTKRPRRALHWWRKAIREGERLRAPIQLARTYFEIGRCLIKSEIGRPALDSMTAREYLDNAGRLFDEFKLTWDQERLRGLDHNSVDDLTADRCS